MSSEITRRAFIVGCPRSGTTLLQSLLAAHSHIVSFPETHFYERLFGGRLRSILGVPSRKVKSHWKNVLEEIGHTEMGSFLPEHPLFIRQYSKAFLQILDTLTRNQGKQVWLEKTPGHLHVIDEIEKYVPHPQFIHILRNGGDNIASLFEAGKRYPKFWSREFGTLDQCIQNWITDIRISLKYLQAENHRVVKYESMATHPEMVLEKLCTFIGVPFEAGMVSNYAESADQLILEKEPWKGSIKGPITAQTSRFYEYLDEEQRQYTRSQIPQDLLDFFHPQQDQQSLRKK
jgi:hypothetical protein